ncbi:UNVERIFIED_CONTAM: hypothetical protein HDU68_001436 [Siphonaria sp. JEL0065]|nr:hypothetical protein HDU68_001436 [Siphonaria sp. JEL0065]
MSVVNKCDQLVSTSSSQTTTATETLTSYEGVKAELLHYARMQLDILGSESDLFSSSIHKVTEQVNEMMGHLTGNDGSPEEERKMKPVETITNKELKDALENAEAFDALYLVRASLPLVLAQTLIRIQNSPYQVEPSKDLNQVNGSLNSHRKQYTQASTIWEQVTTQVGGSGWESMDEAVLEKLVVCQKELKNPGPLVDACLRLLGTTVTGSSSGNEKFGGNVDDIVDLINGASGAVGATGSSKFSGLKIFKVSVNKFLNRIGNNDTHLLEIQIDNHLPKAIKVQAISSALSGKELAGLTCQMENVDLEPGVNTVRLACERVSSAGMYLVESVTLKIGNASLEYEMPKTGIKKRAFNIVGQVEAMHLSVKPLESNDALAQRPVSVRNGTTHFFQVDLSRPIKPIQSAAITVIPLTASTMIPTILPTNTTIQIKDTATQNPLRQYETTSASNDRQISFPDLNTSETATFIIPLSLTDPDTNHVSVKFFVVYTTSNDGKDHTFTKTVNIQLEPVLKVSHVLVPRGSGLLLQVQVVGGSKIPLRIDGASVGGLDGGFRVVDWCCGVEGGLLFRGQTVSLVYLLEHCDDAFSRHGQKATVNIKYHSTLDEIRHHINQKLDAFLIPKNKTQYSQFLSRQIISILNLEPAKYSLLGQLPFPETIDAATMDALKKAMEMEDKEVVDLVSGLFVEFVKEMGVLDVEEVKKHELVPKECVERLEYAFETADYQIVLSVDVKPVLRAGQKAVVAGDILSCKLKITNTFWSASDDSVDAVYEITVNEANWVLAGHKRHKFHFKKGHEVEFPFDLVSVGAGKLLLPSVNVQAIKAECGVYCMYPSSEEVLVFPADSKSLIIRL